MLVGNLKVVGIEAERFRVISDVDKAVSFLVIRDEAVSFLVIRDEAVSFLVAEVDAASSNYVKAEGCWIVHDEAESLCVTGVGVKAI